MTSWRGFGPGGLRDGRGEMQISLSKDKEGMIGRECPQTYCELKYFKISMNDVPDRVGSDLSNIQLFCPYCGTEAHMQTYRTKAQTDYAISIASRSILGEINDMFRGMIKDFNRSSPRGGWISLRLDFKPATLPIITKYIEKDLKRIVQCDDCGGGYAVYGISNYCPWCGEGNLDVHFERNVELIKKILSHYDEIARDDAEAGYLFLGTNLEKCVGLYEGFLKHNYFNRIKKQYDAEVAKSKIESIKTAFQNLNRSQSIFTDEFGIDIFQTLNSEDMEFLQVRFSKRHVLTHNLGLVDEKYLTQVKSWQKPGQEIPLESEEIERTLELISQVLRNII